MDSPKEIVVSVKTKHTYKVGEDRLELDTPLTVDMKKYKKTGENNHFIFYTRKSSK